MYQGSKINFKKKWYSFLLVPKGFEIVASSNFLVASLLVHTQLRSCSMSDVATKDCSLWIFCNGYTTDLLISREIHPQLSQEHCTFCKLSENTFFFNGGIHKQTLLVYKDFFYPGQS